MTNIVVLMVKSELPLHSDSALLTHLSRHPEVTKNSYYVLSPKGELNIGINSWNNREYLNKVAKINE